MAHHLVVRVGPEDGAQVPDATHSPHEQGVRVLVVGFVLLAVRRWPAIALAMSPVHVLERTLREVSAA